MYQLGLIGGESIAKYSVAHMVWQEIIHASHSGTRFNYYPTVSGDGLVNRLSQVRSGEILGVNVALPWKEAAAAHCEEQSEVVAATGYVNTVYSRDGWLHADNTDGRGFLRGLGDSPNQHALIFGAGGAGTVLAYELIIRGSKVVVADIEGRALSKLEHLAQNWAGNERLQLLNTRDLVPKDFDLIVNATPLGRGLPFASVADPNMSKSPMPDDFAKKVPEAATFAEMNYYPPKTKFLNQVALAKHPIVLGLAMLLHQALLSYQDYTGDLLGDDQVGIIIQRLETELIDNS